MPKGRFPPIAPPEPQEAMRTPMRGKAKARAFPLQASVPLVEMLVVIGIGMTLLLA